MVDGEADLVGLGLLHEVGVEDAEDGADGQLPVRLEHVAEQEQRHRLGHVLQVAQLPDGVPLALSKRYEKNSVKLGKTRYASLRAGSRVFQNLRYRLATITRSS